MATSDQRKKRKGEECIIVWDLEKRDTAKAVQCLATSDDTASRIYIKISKSIYSTHISFRHRYKLKKLTEETNPTSTEVTEDILNSKLKVGQYQSCVGGFFMIGILCSIDLSI